MFQLTPYGQQIVSQYQGVVPEILTVTIPFSQYQSANATTNTLSSDEVTDDILVLEFGVDFLNALVKMLIQDNTGYFWNENQQFAPVHALAGAATQVMPIIPIPIEYFLPANSRLKFQFKNASSSPETVDRFLTIRCLRLKTKK